MKHFLLYLISTVGIAALVSSAAHADTNVVTSIKPIHSLVSGVMKDVGKPHLVVDGAGSPHTYNMKPSDAKALSNANVVFWIGEGLEGFLQTPIKNLAEKAKVVELGEIKGLVKLDIREGGQWDEHDHDHGAHGHDDHGHQDHAHKDHAHDDHKHKHKHAHDHGHKDKHAKKGHSHDHHDHKDKKKAAHKHDDHGHKDHAHKEKKEKHADKHGHGHDHGHHAHGAHDQHFWLDPENAKLMVQSIANTLSEADPKHKATYAANAKAMIKRIDALSDTLAKDLSAVKDKPFIVFHDAYQYFEKRFGLKAVGSVTVSVEQQPGAKRVSEIQEKIKTLGATCVFSEPQFEPKIVKVIIEGTKAKTGVLDPLGADIQNGPDLYFDLLKNNANALTTCMASSS